MSAEQREAEYVDLTPETAAMEHLCCIIRKKAAHAGIDAKRRWLADRLREGHVFRKLRADATVFIEYAPVETAWVPVLGDNFLYVYCLWADGPYKGKGHGKALMERCIADAKAKGKSGICMLGAAKQKAWLTDQEFAKGFGFKAVDSTGNGYELLALSFDGTAPRFSAAAKAMRIDSDELTIYYDDQCPYVAKSLEVVEGYCGANGVPLKAVRVDTLEKAKNLPGVFNNWCVFYKGEFRTVNLLLDVEVLKRILKK